MKMYITKAVNCEVETSEEMAKAVTEAARRFMANDWGIIPEEDKEQNRKDLAERDGHILGRYHTPGGDIYIDLEFAESEADDYAVIMYCNEY